MRRFCGSYVLVLLLVSHAHAAPAGRACAGKRVDLGRAFDDPGCQFKGEAPKKIPAGIRVRLFGPRRVRAGQKATLRLVIQNTTGQRRELYLRGDKSMAMAHGFTGRGRPQARAIQADLVVLKPDGHLLEARKVRNLFATTYPAFHVSLAPRGTAVGRVLWTAASRSYKCVKLAKGAQLCGNFNGAPLPPGRYTLRVSVRWGAGLGPGLDDTPAPWVAEWKVRVVR